MKDRRRDLREYRRRSEQLKRQTKARGLTCWRCHQPFDWSLPYTDRMAFTADHVTPLARGGAILGPLQPAHRACNSSRGTGDHEDRLPTTRTW